MKKALFLDRDGTLIQAKHYICDPDDVIVLPGVARALNKAQQNGYLLFILSNQEGIGRGYFTIEDVNACNQRMLEQLDLGPDVFTEICVAPEILSQPSRYRKPSPYFILEMIKKHGLDPTQCWMIGDRFSDAETGRNAGINSLGIGAKVNTTTADPATSGTVRILHNLSEAVDFILSPSRD